MGEKIGIVPEYLSIFHQALKPYLSMDGEYVGRERAAEVFPYSSNLEGTLHSATCFAEDLEGTLLNPQCPTALVVQNPLNTIEQNPDMLITTENGLGYLIHRIEELINAGPSQPNAGNDFLASDGLVSFLEPAARQIGLQVVDIPYQDSQKSIYPEQVIRGEALGYRRMLGDYAYIAGFSKDGVKTLLQLFTQQLLLAGEYEKLSRFGSIIKESLSNPEIVDFIAARFYLGQKNVFDQLKLTGSSITTYLGDNWWLLDPDLVKTYSAYKGVNRSWRGSGFFTNILTERGKQVISEASTFPDMSKLFRKMKPSV